MRDTTLSPSCWLGLLGGGQLGRMFCMAAQSLGYRVAVLDPGAESPAASVADLHIAADYLDLTGLDRLAKLCSAVTTEFENVPADSLRVLSQNTRVSPTAESVAVAQDRSAEKQFIAGCGVAVAPHALIGGVHDLDNVPPELFPGILKVSRLGYDGKGQVHVTSSDEARAAFLHLGGVACVLEKKLDIDYEVSVVVARSYDGHCVTYPVAHNIHREAILSVSTVPAERVGAAVAEMSRQVALQVAQRLEYCGVLCVEFFVLRNGRLLVNEIAPRPHNSGHYTIDACVTSQFEQQVRVLADLPLGSTRQHSPAVMLNLLGDLWFANNSSQSVEPDWTRVLSHDCARLHLYGKREARPGRKMGHVTVVGQSQAQAEAGAREIAQRLGIAPW